MRRYRQEEASAIFSLDDIPPSMEVFFEDYSRLVITGIRVYREPLVAAIQAVVETIRMKKFSEKVYHVFQVLEVNDHSGKSYLRVDKNEMVEYKKSLSWPKGEHMIVDGVKEAHLTVKQYFSRAEQTYRKSFWKYDPVGANCQWFVYWCLKANKLLTNKLETWFLQRNISVPAASRAIMKSVTNVAGVGSRLVGQIKKTANTKLTQAKDRLKSKVKKASSSLFSKLLNKKQTKSSSGLQSMVHRLFFNK